MEFLKTCSTNAQAIGEYEAIAYQAFSITRDTDQNPPRSRDWGTSDDVHAAEAELRQGRNLVTQDASRPWLWHFEPITVEMVGQDTMELPALEGYRLHREQRGFMKASEMARPPMRPGNPQTFTHAATSSASAGPQKGIHGAGARFVQGHNQAGATEQHQALDCFTVYELFATSITALISYFLVKNCKAVALNYRTFVSKPAVQQEVGHAGAIVPDDLHWLTSISVHWISAGTLVISTNTVRTRTLRSLDAISPDDEPQFIGKCIRVAPNGMLARISSFEDPLDLATEDLNRRAPRKRAKTSALEQSVEKWKATVERWLHWRGYSLPNLADRTSWVRIRIAQSTQVPVASPISATLDRDTLWPRVLCYYRQSEPASALRIVSHGESRPRRSLSDLRWFETPTSIGFKDPLDVAQEWFAGKVERDKTVEARRKAKKVEEDAMRRKDEPSGLLASSPFNARAGVYGDLQAVGGVYPTPPDGIAPGPGLSSTDTPSVSGATSNVVLVPGGTNPAINLSAPQDHPQMDDQQHPSTSPAFPATMDPFPTSGDGEDDDLFEDIDGEGYGGNGVNEADFDFFDGPDEDDVDMADAPALPRSNAENHAKHGRDAEAIVAPEHIIKDESSDPLVALENALATPTQPNDEDMQDVKYEPPQKTVAQPTHFEAETPASQPDYVLAPNSNPRVEDPTPPLSPTAIAKTLRPSPPKALSRKLQTPTSHDHDGSSFHSLDFSRRLSLVDAKYQEGRFATHLETDPKRECSPSSTVPTRTKSLRDVPLLTKLRYAIGVASVPTLPDVTALARSFSDDSESDGESDITEVSEEETEDVTEVKLPPFLGRLIIPTKRKLPTEGHGTPLSVTSFADSFGGEWQDFSGLQLDEASLALFEPNSWDWPMLSLPSPTERPVGGARYAVPVLPPPNIQMPDTPTSQPDLSIDISDEKPLNGKDSIAITQIVTDQIISATLDLLGEDELPAAMNDASSAETRWHSILKHIFPKATDCSASALVAIHDVFPDLSAQAKGQQRPQPRKPNESSAVPSNHMYQMTSPFVRVRRAETHWDLLPPSIAFWEPLGLHPVSAPKNVVAFCIYPHSESLRPVLERFMLNLQLAYDTCKLGTHARVDSLADFEGGLVPCKVPSQTSPKDAFKALKETCVQLGKLLAMQYAQIQEQQDMKIDAFVIYMVDPFGNPTALWELCSAFWLLFQTYVQAPRRMDTTQNPDLVLQILPIRYLASFDVPVILDPSTYVHLAREVYDRCPPSAASTDKTPLSIYKAPAFQLEESLPRNIQFKLLSEPPQDLLRENSYMHLAYAMSLDGTWVTAAWTDSCGKSQAVVSYHLGTRVFSEVAKEIWQTTIEILHSRRVQWRVCITKFGSMDREELETWVLLITCPTQVNLFLTLLTVVEDSPYKFIPSSPAATNSTSATTPDSTPQPGVSPDPSIGLTPAATPSADSAPDLSADPDARLIDVTDETWGIILAHRLHNSNSTNQFSPALISGLLVKRGETHATSNSIHHPIPDPEQGPIAIAVNILWIGAVGSTRAATSPFPPASDGVSPGGASPGPSPTQERSTTSLMWTPTVQTRATAENLLKEVLAQFRGLGLLAKLRGMRGTRHGTLPWHVVAAMRGVEGLGRVTGGM
ncbi:hypothetical protein CC86DRAFT_371064 [Ophiobolus disseminans]|uniref:Mediator of RNA polymerase II transcription subunit 13 n=1 Tax=Ophiobolus disseminans TaxID=1469910 RepID=A0A6A6ZWD1_9PLEO|nr:hypothetical protein CC86DRAFT_371064 [Ophiobolus disseminans]